MMKHVVSGFERARNQVYKYQSVEVILPIKISMFQFNTGLKKKKKGKDLPE